MARYKARWSTERGSNDVVSYINAVSEKHARKKLYKKYGDIVIVYVKLDDNA